MGQNEISVSLGIRSVKGYWISLKVLLSFPGTDLENQHHSLCDVQPHASMIMNMYLNAKRMNGSLA